MVCQRNYQIPLHPHVRKNGHIYIYIYIYINVELTSKLKTYHLKISVRPNSPHISSMNGSKRKHQKDYNDENQTSFKNNNSKRNVRIRVISSNNSESRPSWYKSMRMRRFSTATASTNSESKSNIGKRLLRYTL